MPRLAIGPANYAGQAHAWAKAVERHLGVPADSFNRGPVRRHEFRFSTDREIPAPLFFAPLLRHARMKGFLHGYSHVILDGYQTFFQTPQRRDIGADATFLAGEGFQVALLAHGTDVRQPDDHMARNRYSYFHEGDESWRQDRRAMARSNLQVAEGSGLPLFVSTPDLLHDLPQSTWIPVVVDVDAFVCRTPVLRRAVPRVLHLPSKAVPPIKGTQYIRPVLQKLAAEGLIEDVQPGRVPHARMPDLIRSVDVVVDQLLTPTPGVATAEAMAAGRVVLSSMDAGTLQFMPEAPPLEAVDPQNLEQRLRCILDDREPFRERAVRGPVFARRWHDGRESANRLARFLGVASHSLS